MLKSFLTQIADAFRASLGTTENIPAQSFPLKVAEVHDAGYQGGYEDGYGFGMRDGYEGGLNQAEYNFWNTYQQNGERANYANAFYGAGWTDENYNPIYLIKPTSCNSMYNISSITDTKVPIDLTVVGTNSQAFAWATRLVTINEVKFAADVPVASNCFDGCSRLQNITVTGELGCNMKFGDCTQLSYDSLMNIISHLAVVSTTKTLTLGAANLIKLTDAEKAIATGKGWTLA